MIWRSHCAASARVNTRKLVLLAAIPAALAVAAPSVASSATGHQAAGKTVTLKNIAFKPAKLSVSRGSTVTFKWADGATPHNVTSKGKKKFKSSPTKSKGTYRVRFASKGTFGYVCTIHPGMSGRITVK